MICWRAWKPFKGESNNGAVANLDKPLTRGTALNFLLENFIIKFEISQPWEANCWMGKNLKMKFNISSQHMKYGRKALDFALTPGYKRIGLLRKGLVLLERCHNGTFPLTNRTREPTTNFISSYRYHQRHLKPIWKNFHLRKTKHCGSHWQMNP